MRHAIIALLVVGWLFRVAYYDENFQPAGHTSSYVWATESECAEAKWHWQQSAEIVCGTGPCAPHWIVSDCMVGNGAAAPGETR